MDALYSPVPEGTFRWCDTIETRYSTLHNLNDEVKKLTVELIILQRHIADPTISIISYVDLCNNILEGNNQFQSIHQHQWGF